MKVFVNQSIVVKLCIINGRSRFYLKNGSVGHGQVYIADLRSWWLTRGLGGRLSDHR